MAREITVFRTREGQAEAFAEAYRGVADILVDEEGSRGVSLHRGVEDPDSFTLIQLLSLWIGSLQRNPSARAEGKPRPSPQAPERRPHAGGAVCGLQGLEQRLKLLAAVAAPVEVVPDERHRRRVQPGKLRLHEAVQLLEALVAADLLFVGHTQRPRQFAELLGVQHRDVLSPISNLDHS